MIPAWNMAGVIPPIRPGQPGHSTDRSPYAAPLATVAERFAQSSQRLKILNGLLEYRSELHRLGLTSGFQWLDGSFLEDIEAREARPPKDIDVVTYFHLPEGESQASLHAKAGRLFDHEFVARTYYVDAYQGILGEPFNLSVVRRLAYWYSMWSHRRDGLWKGFVEVDLSHSGDAAALAILTSRSVGVASP